MSHVRLYTRIIVSNSHGIGNTFGYVDTVTFFQNLTKRSMTQGWWTLTPLLLRSHVWLYPRVNISNFHENTSKYEDTVTLFSKTLTKGHWPLDDLWPQVCWGHMCDSTQGSLCPSPMRIHWSMWIQWPFFQNLNQRSLTPRWPLTPHVLRSHVWLFPRIIVFMSHGDTSMYVDTGRWSILQNTTYYVYIHTTYTYIHTLYRMSDHMVSFWTKFRCMRQKLHVGLLIMIFKKSFPNC